MSWKHFSDDELRCHCGCGKVLMDEGMMSKLELMRSILSFPFKISSGYRCPEHNNEVSHTGLDGPHTTGRAVDILCSHKEAFQIVNIAPDFGFTGMGVNQKGNKRFVHIDDLEEVPGCPRPHIWTY